MKVLLLSDTTMCADAGGFSQTLYNIFSLFEPDNILCITSTSAYDECKPSTKYENRYIYYQFGVFKIPKNRFAQYVLPPLEWINYNYTGFKKFKRIRRQIESFAPDVVISCSNGPTGLFMHDKLIQGLNIKNIFPYFMDDWMYQKRTKWLDKKIGKWTKKILSENTSWLMISKELSDLLADRYGAVPEKLLEIHNPVDLANASFELIQKKKDEFTLAYAGSLWPMHFDAFYLIAKGVNQLQDKKKIRLILYTKKSFWDYHKHLLQPLNVIYGGNIPYNQIHQKLSEADALVVTSSFSKEWYTHSRGSVQTKITDYLKASRLVISCGPKYSANHKFLKKHQCGVCIETADASSVALQLNEVFDNISDYENMVKNGWEVLEKEFTFSSVHHKLTNFLQAS